MGDNAHEKTSSTPSKIPIRGSNQGTKIKTLTPK